LRTPDYSAPNAIPGPLTLPMKFLSRFLAFCLRIFLAFADLLGVSWIQRTRALAGLTPPEQPTAKPDGTTPCVRFLNSDRKYSRAQGRPTYRAFQAAFDQEENAIVLSMYRTDGLEADAIWELGRNILGPDGGRLHGRAELLANEIEALPEKVVAARKFKARFDLEPPRHVTIAPWDDDKEDRKLHAMDLASVARLYLL
jgi:hypothetical protein